MAGPTGGNTISLNQDQVLTMHDQVLGLAMVIGMPPPPNGGYDAAYGQMLNGAIQEIIGANTRYVVPNPEDDAYNTVSERIYMGLDPQFASSFGLESAADVKELLQNVDEYTLTLNQLQASGVDFAALAQQQQQQTNTQSQPQMRTETRTQPSREVPDDVKARVQRVEAALKNSAGSIDGLSESSIGAIDGILDEKSYAAYETALSFMAQKAGLSDELAAQGGTYTPAFGQQLKTALDGRLDTALSLAGRALLDEDTIKGYEALKRSLPQLVSDLNYLHEKNELRPVTTQTVTVQIPVETPQENVPAGNQNNVSDNQGGGSANDEQPENTNQNNQPEQSVRTLSAEVIADNKLIQETLRDALAEQGLSTQGLRTDGQWDQTSLTKLNAVIDIIKAQTGLNTGEFSATGYVSGLGDAIKQKIASDDALKTQVLNVMTEADLNKLLDTMEGLSAQNELRVSVGSGATVQQGPAEMTTELATKVVEQALFKIGGQMAGAQGGGEGGMLSMITGALGGGETKGPFTPLTEEQANDGVFDNASRDLTAQAIMMLKGMNGDENADGSYDENVGNQLMMGILTKDSFNDIRNQMTMSAEQAALLGISVPEGNSTTLPIPKMSEEHARELLSGHYDQLTSKFQSEAEFNAYRERIMPLTLMFDSMNKLHQENILMDNERAKQVNNKNMMLDMAGQMMDQFAPGLKSFLQDFFTNSEFGKMISGVLAVFGINVGRLWGDNDENAALERAEPAIAKGFEHFYENAKDDLTEELSRDPNHQEVMARTSEDMMEKLEGSWAFGKAMDILFKDQDEQVIHDAVENALAQASAQSTPEASRQAFSQSLIEAGKQFQNGQDLDVAAINAYLAEAQQEIQATNGTIPTTSEGQTNAVGGVIPGNTQENQGAGNNTGNDTNASSNVTSEVLTQASINESTGQPHTRNDEAPVVDADVVEAGNQRVELAFTPNRDEWVQGPLRYSHGRVQDIQEVLGNNADKLDLSLDADMMKINGTYSDMMTVNTNAVIEETLIRAQIHKITESGEELTQAKLDGLDRTLTPDNIDIVTDYMAAKGLSEADIAKFSGAVVGQKSNPEDNVRIDGMAVDFFSTNPRDPSAGEKQDHTVMRQSHFGNQFKLSLADWAPQVVPDVDPNTDADPLRDRYLEYNKDRPCEVPKFYKNEENGSVMALIRDKNGNDDPSDDTFRELEFDHYLDTHRIQDSDGEDLKALLDNYNWQNPTDEGVRNHINKVLCLDPFNYNHTPEGNQPYVATVTEQQNNNDDAGNNRTRNYEERHAVPETFKDLRKLTEEQADFLSEMMDLESMGGIGNVAERDIKHPLDVMFENAIGNDDYNSGYVVLELEAFGFDHPDFDAVVAMRDGNSIDYRYVDYDTDYIKPLSEQRIGGGDISVPHNPDSGPRRLDDFLDEVSRPVGGNLNFAPSGGYLAMLSIVPSGENGIKSVNAMDAVYGNGASSRYQQDYITNYNRRFNERTAEEALNNASRMYSNENFTGLSEDERRRLDEYAAQQRSSNSPRQGEFNNRSGVEEERRQEQCKPIPQTPGIGAPWINKINRFKNKFGNDDCEEEPPTNSEGRVRENMSDMGVMPEAAEGDILGVYSPQLDNNSNASMGAGR